MTDSGANTGIAGRLDRLPVAPLHVAVAALCGFGLFIDVAELSLNGALSVVFSAPPYGMTPTLLGMLMASVFVGGAIGAPLLGRLADRHGRRLALQMSLLLVALPSLAAVIGADGTELIVYRFLSGMALGAYPPLMTAYLSDILPPRRRARVIFLAVSFGLLGWPAIIFLVRSLTPIAPLGLEGWRWSLLLAGVGAAAGAFALRLVPESPRWLAVAGRAEAAELACRRFERSAGLPAPAGPAASVAGEDAAGHGAGGAGHAASGAAKRAALGPYASRVLLVGTVYLLRAWSTVGFPMVSGAVLVAKGWAVGDSLLFVGIAGIGSSLGALFASFVADRFERRTALTLCSIAMVGLGLTFAASETPLVLVATGTAMTLLGAIYGPLLSVYAAELFPTSVRASATATAWSANRLGSALAPLALLPLLHAGGPMAVLATVAATLVVNLVLILAFGPRGLAGRPILE